MYDAFKKWSMSGHTFTFVKLTAAEVESLGAATQQFLEPEGDGDKPAMVKNGRMADSCSRLPYIEVAATQQYC